MKFETVISTLLFGVIFTLSSSSSSSVFGARIKSQPSLYNRTDGIHSLTTQTFDQIYGKRNSFLVVFYADWCGHCIAFAPKYKKLGRDIVLWKEVIQLAAVNCADPKNLAVCRDQQVLSYPYVKYFEPMISKGNLGQEFDVGDTRMESMRENLIRILLQTSLNERITSTSNWPDFRSLNATNKQELLQKIVHTMTKPVLAVIEPFDSLLGMQVRLIFYSNLSFLLSFLNIFPLLLSRLSLTCHRIVIQLLSIKLHRPISIEILSLISGSWKSNSLHWFS